MPSSRRCQYVARAGIFLIVLVLVSGMVDCGDAVAKYSLTLAVVSGNGTATDLTNTSPYAAGTKVSIKAVAAAGYQFVNWTAPAGTFTDESVAQTVFTMPTQNVVVAANFVAVAVYNLTISTTAGGSTTTEGFLYPPYVNGTVVYLSATPHTCYLFINWTGDVGTITDVNDATTTITMNGDYAITANFIRAEVPQNLEIRTWYDLDAVRDNVCDNHILMNDLDSTTPGYEELASPAANQGKGWRPIGDSYYTKFAGTFDGGGYEIKDLFINRPDEMYVGLFGVVGEDGVIENIGVVNATMAGVEMVGGLVGKNYCTINNSYSTGNVTGVDHVGGLVGKNYGIINNSYSSGNVTCGVNVGGGLVGANDGFVSDSYSTGSVTGNRNVGGLLGHNHGNVSNSYSTDTVVGMGDWVGGLLGTNGGTVSNSYSTGSVAGYEYIGGLVGWNSGTVGNSYSTGSVTGNGFVGGLVGGSSDTVSNSFWDMETSGQSTSAGGTGKKTAQMQNITTFLGVEWSIIAVALNQTNPSYIWNIVNALTYPFLSWES